MKRVKKGIRFILITLIMLTLVTGCWGSREVEDLAFVVGIGIDSGEKPESYKVTYQMALPEKSGEGGAKTKDWTITIEGGSLRYTNEKIYEVLNKEPFVGTTKIIIIGETVAREGINRSIDFLQRFSEFRRTAYMFVAKGKAEEVFNTERRTGSVPTLNILTQMEQNSAVSTAPVYRLGHFLTINSTPGMTPMLPVLDVLDKGEEGMNYKEKMKQVILHKAAVFDSEARLVEYLTDKETKGALWLNGEVKNRFLSTEDLDDEEGIIAGTVLKTSTNYKLIEEEGIKISFNIKATVDVEEIQGTKFEAFPEDLSKKSEEVKEKFKEIIIKECEAAVKKNKELKVDFLGLGRKIERKRPGLWEELKDDWKNTVSEVQVIVNVDILVQNFGTSTNPPTSL